MGFGKAFGAGLGIMIGFNALLAILWLVFGGLSTNVAGDMATLFNAWISGWSANLLPTLFGLLSGSGMSMLAMGSLINAIMGWGMALDIWLLLYYVIVMVVYIVAAAVIGYLAHSPAAGAGAWFVVNAIMVVFGYLAVLLVFGPLMTVVAIPLLTTIIAPIVVNGLAYGLVAMGMGYKYEE